MEEGKTEEAILHLRKCFEARVKLLQHFVEPLEQETKPRELLALLLR